MKKKINLSERRLNNLVKNTVRNVLLEGLGNTPQVESDVQLKEEINGYLEAIMHYMFNYTSTFSNLRGNAGNNQEITDDLNAITTILTKAVNELRQISNKYGTWTGTKERQNNRYNQYVPSLNT